VAEGLPPDTRGGVGVAGEAAEFAAAMVALLRLPPHERRRLASEANLQSLTWRQRLRNLLPLLEEVRRARVTVH
jgi:hypothetical protein